MGVSVIVPVYNAEKYLEECVDSILGQTISELELLLIDDGSADQSGRICDRYACLDSRVRVIHKQNEGRVRARLDGVRMASYDCIAFIDADDWVDADFLETMAENMERNAADLVVSGCMIEDRQTRIKVQNRIAEGVYGRDEMVRSVYPVMLHYKEFYKFGILPYMCNKLFRKSLFEACCADMDTSIYDGEDVAIVYPFLLMADRLSVMQDAKYHYRIHGMATTVRKREDYYENVAKLYLYLNRKFKELGFYEMMHTQLDQYMRMMVWQGGREHFIETMKDIFPFVQVPRGAKVILYGAGYVGKIYYRQLCLSGYCDIIAWVDQNYCNEALQMLGVEAIDAIKQYDYDYIVVAVADAGLQEQIADRLQSVFGIEAGRIIVAGHGM